MKYREANDPRPEPLKGDGIVRMKVAGKVRTWASARSYISGLNIAARAVVEALAEDDKGEIGLEEHPGKVEAAYEHFYKMRDKLGPYEMLELTRGYRRSKGFSK
jgi:hypothetical protein